MSIPKNSLREEVVKQIKGYPYLRNKIASTADVHRDTVRRWLDTNSEKLLQYSVLIVISETLNKPIDEITN